MSTPEQVTPVFYDHASLWTGTDDDAGHTTDGGRVFGITRRRYVECDRYKCPAVVVIDPEDREQVEALDAAYQAAIDSSPKYDGLYDVMQTALRSLIADPKPKEPQGLGAVVEASDGLRYVRSDVATCNPWRAENGYPHEWSDIAAVRVLSEGVTA